MQSLVDTIVSQYDTSRSLRLSRPLSKSLSNLPVVKKPQPKPIGEGEIRKEVYTKSGQLTSIEAVRKKQFDDAEALFFGQECFRLKLEKIDEKLTRKLELNGIRIKMQRKRQGQLDTFDLSSTPNAKSLDPGSVDRKKIQNKKLFFEIQDKKLKQVKNAMQLECYRAVGKTRTERKEFTAVRINKTKGTISDLPIKLRLYLKPYRLKVRQRSRYFVKKILLKVAKMNLSPADVGIIK